MAILSEAVVTEGEALGISMLNSCLEPTVTDQREVGPRTSLRLVEAYSLLFSNMLQRKCLFSVYRLEEDGSVLKEGGVRLTV